ncbi:hypothetical protein KP509_09G001000 [Ceratopteris richardii]|uniref:Uncharacterized protein n=1 Tax=Ceratopteris richardii TaxID=49495 RepID=A0A8T2U457_CERRI|nr:hypothetical protein KP509_09G001000 [Ceratopteris richardii]
MLTSTLSIFYRIPGAFLAAVLLVGISLLKVGHLSLTFENRLIVVTFLALSYYMSNGVCYLWWDSGLVLDLKEVHTSRIPMLFCAAPLAFLTLLRVLFS